MALQAANQKLTGLKDERSERDFALSTFESQRSVVRTMMMQPEQGGQGRFGQREARAKREQAAQALQQVRCGSLGLSLLVLSQLAHPNAQAAATLHRAEQSYAATASERKVSAGAGVDSTAKTTAQLVSQYMTHCAKVLVGPHQQGGSPQSQPHPEPQPQPPVAHANTYHVHLARTPQGLGMIVNSTTANNPIVERLTPGGVAAEAKVLCGSLIVTCCGHSVSGSGQQGLIALIKSLPPTSQIHLTLTRPTPNWQATVRR